MRYEFNGEERLKDKAIFAAIIIFAVVGILDVFLPNADVILLARTLQAAGSATVVVVYWPDFVEALRTNKPQLGDFLIFGVTGRMDGDVLPGHVRDHLPLSATPGGSPIRISTLLWIAMSILSSVMHVIAPGLSGTKCRGAIGSASASAHIHGCVSGVQRHADQAGSRPTHWSARGPT